VPKVTPGQEAPELSVETIGGQRWTLSERDPERFTMVVFYRGLHCPVCRKYIGELDGLVGDFAERGVDVIAVSGDDEDQAEQSREGWELENVEIGFGLSEEEMAAWDLFVSSGLLDDEPERFGEPGLFLVDAENVVYYAAVNSMPFGRPSLTEMLDAVDFVIEKDFPARGTVELASSASG